MTLSGNYIWVRGSARVETIGRLSAKKSALRELMKTSASVVSFTYAECTLASYWCAYRCGFKNMGRPADAEHAESHVLQGGK